MPAAGKAVGEPDIGVDPDGLMAPSGHMAGNLRLTRQFDPKGARTKSGASEKSGLAHQNCSTAG